MVPLLKLYNIFVTFPFIRIAKFSSFAIIVVDRYTYTYNVLLLVTFSFLATSHTHSYSNTIQTVA